MTQTTAIINTEKTSESYSVKSTMSLMARYHRDLIYDCHSLRARISRSLAREELEKRGPAAFVQIARYLRFFLKEKEVIPTDKEWKSEESKYWTLAIGWMWLLHDIVKTHTLADSPYGKEATYGEQDMSVWADYCEKMAK